MHQRYSVIIFCQADVLLLFKLQIFNVVFSIGNGFILAHKIHLQFFKIRHQVGYADIMRLQLWTVFFGYAQCFGIGVNVIV